MTIQLVQTLLNNDDHDKMQSICQSDDDEEVDDSLVVIIHEEVDEVEQYNIEKLIWHQELKYEYLYDVDEQNEHVQITLAVADEAHDAHLFYV